MTTIAQITDLHIDNAVPELKHLDSRAKVLAVLDAIQQRSIEQLIISGDIAETRSGISWFLELIAQRGFKYHIILGNHDVRKPYVEKKVLGRPPYYYAVGLDGFLVLFMDSANNCVDQGQLTWLAEQLSQGAQDVLVFIHHPVLDCGNSLMDKKYPLKNRDEVLSVLTQTKRSIALFCGHYHTEEIVKYANVTQYVTPAVLYQLKKYSEMPEIENELSGYRILSIESGTLETEVRYLERV